MEQHGHAANVTPTYTTWQGMIERTTNENARNYDRYGGAGISVCDEWRDFRVFLQDMGIRPEGTTLERLDNAKGYEPSNCVWGTYAEQARNRSTNRYVTAFGHTQVMADWAKDAGLHLQTLKARLDAGWDVEDAITTPVVERKRRKVVRIKETAQERFESKLEPQGMCLVWTAATVNGYGMFQPETGKSVSAHRYSWLLANPGATLDMRTNIIQTCGNPLCCEPTHLLAEPRKQLAA